MRRSKRPTRFPPSVAGGKKRQATTLLEMLVVIGIIGVLMSMLIPSLKRSMQVAASAVCMQNLRQIGSCLTMYRLDNDGWLPTDLDTGDEGDQDEGEGIASGERSDAWFLKMQPTYLHDPLLMSCPADPFRFEMEEELRRPNPDIGDLASYGINNFIMAAAGGRLADLDRHRPSRPLDTILVTDLGPDTFQVEPGDEGKPGLRPIRKGGLATWDDGYSLFPLGQFRTPWVTRRHGHGINMLTLGGSTVRAARTEEVMKRMVRPYYRACAAGGCALCNNGEAGKPLIFHYSFAQDHLYWWTGSITLN